MKAILFFLCLLSAALQATAQDSISIAIDALVSQYDSPDAPGLSMAVIKDGNMAYRKNTGLANLEHKISISDSTTFSIASVAKQFTAACVWSLIAENKITLDDDIRKYLPELPDYGQSIKIRHLLNHTSGLRNYHTLMHLSGFDYDTEYYDNAKILELASMQNGLNNIPGEKVLYGNTPYNLLAIMIERVSGSNLNDYANQKLFKPLGMSSTVIPTNNNIFIKNKATGYLQNEDKSYTAYSKMQQSYGAGSMYTTIGDMAIWTNVLNGENTNLRDLTDFLITTEILLHGEAAHYARGVMTDNYKEHKTVHHSGYGDGCQSQVITLPELNLSVIIFTNLQHINPTPLSYKIVDLYLSNTSVNPKKNDSEVLAARNLKQFTGHYRELNSDMQMELLLENSVLKARSAQSQNGINLKATGKNKFCRENNESVKYEFCAAKKMPYDMVAYFGGTPFYFKKVKPYVPRTLDLELYSGKYYSEELRVNYTFFVESDNLYLSYKNHEKIKLTAVGNNEFGNTDRTLYTFRPDKYGTVKSFTLASDGSINNVQFFKVNH